MKQKLTILALALGLLVPAAAHAQRFASPPPPEPEPDPSRSGLVFGLGIGGGSLALEGPAEEGRDLGSVFFEVHAGGMLSSRTALLLELWGSDHSLDDCGVDACFEEKGNIGQGNAGLALQYWATPRFWLKGGLGTSRLSYRVLGETRETAKGTAVLAAVGYELFHRTDYALDVQLRLTGASYEEPFFEKYEKASSGALALSFTWY